MSTCVWRIWKRKEKKKKVTFRTGDLNPRFSVISPPMIWIFMESEEPKIKSKQASKRDRTLSHHRSIQNHLLLVPFAFRKTVKHCAGVIVTLGWAVLYIMYINMYKESFDSKNYIPWRHSNSKYSALYS